MIYPTGEQSDTSFRVIAAVFLLLISFGCGSSGGGTGENSAISFSQAKNISNSSGNSENPVVAADPDGNVYAAWEETLPNAHSEIYFVRSGNFSNNFSAVKNLTTATSSICTEAGKVSWNASISAGSDGKAYLAWLDGGTENVSEARVKFFEEKNTLCRYLSPAGQNPLSPGIKIDNQKDVHVIWSGERDPDKVRDVFYRVSLNKGLSFTPSETQTALNVSNTNADSSEPLLGIEGSFYVDTFWVEGGSGAREVTFSRSANGGLSFMTDPLTVSEKGADSFCPALGQYWDSENNISQSYAAFKVENNGESHIYFSKWISFLLIFTPPKVISDAGSAALSPSCPEMAISPSGTIYVAWSEGGKIWAAVSTDAGNYFSPPVSIASSTGEVSSLKIVKSGSNIGIIWVETAGGSSHLNFSGTTDNGLNYLAPVSLAKLSDSGTSGVVTDPVMISDGKNRIYIVWDDGPAEQGEIYLVSGKWNL